MDPADGMDEALESANAVLSEVGAAVAAVKAEITEDPVEDEDEEEDEKAIFTKKDKKSRKEKKEKKDRKDKKDRKEKKEKKRKRELEDDSEGETPMKRVKDEPNEEMGYDDTEVGAADPAAPTQAPTQRAPETESKQPPEDPREFSVIFKKKQPFRPGSVIKDEGTLSNKAKDIVDQMLTTRQQDLQAMKEGKAAVNKLKLLPEVEKVASMSAYQQALVSQKFLQAVEMWLRAPKDQLPSFPIRTTLLRILMNFPYQGDPGRVRSQRELAWKNTGITKEDLMESKLGQHVRKFVSHPNETQENRKLASLLMERWSRLIFGLSKNYKLLEKQEEDSGRISHFRPDEYVIPADIKKYTRDGERVYPDRNADGEPLPTRCRMPKTIMADFIRRPKSEAVTAKPRSEAHAQMQAHVRKLRSGRDRAVVMSIEGSSSTLKAEDK
eukprot:TRINITY_DN710_c1_g2_i1.p1 TRINITY_DN710_c1_g2~~TRINITY_DN710_c1_g2_i1.p1  ORF type:complete len:452 (+),score=169.00 TRINITY_DN710_c1_g2_i1:41-1357(+)